MVRSRKGHAAQRSVAPGPLPQLTANAAGIDVGGTSHFVAVPPDRDGTRSESSARSRATCIGWPSG